MEYQICNCCIMDTTDREIIFDSEGRCNHCKNAEKRLHEIVLNREKYDGIISEIKLAGKNRKYDCIIGVSGGVDSSYVAWLVKELGLRPLAVHFDNGWDSELAVQNIRNLLDKLSIPLFTYVVEWQEFRDLQLSFLKASTPDCEIPTDHMIFAVLNFIAYKKGIKYIINGHNTSSESILPKSWSYGHVDWRYIKDIHKIYGTRKLKTYIHQSMLDYIYYNYVEKIKSYSILDYIDYDKEKAKDFLIREYSWRDYGGKHFESFYTKFYQAYILPYKFGADKRRMHYSSLIIAGQMSREEALKRIQMSQYDKSTLERDIEYFCEKMQISKNEFDEIMKAKPRSYHEYKNLENSFIGKVVSKLNDINL